MDAVDAPDEARMPEDRLEHATRSRRRHAVIAHAFDLEFGACEARIIPLDFEPDSITHKITPFDFQKKSACPVGTCSKSPFSSS